MKNQNDERALLEDQLNWVKQRDAIYAKIENKLYKMKHIAEQFASDLNMPQNQKLRLNEQFLLLKNEVVDLENLL